LASIAFHLALLAQLARDGHGPFPLLRRASSSASTNSAAILILPAVFTTPVALFIAITVPLGFFADAIGRVLTLGVCRTPIGFDIISGT